MAFCPITSWQTDGGKNGNSNRFYFGGSKITADGDCSHEIQKRLFHKILKSYDKSRQCIKKQRHHFANKNLYSKSYGYSRSCVWMWELDHESSLIVTGSILRDVFNTLSQSSPQDQALFACWDQFSSVAQSCLTLQPHGLQHARTPCPSPIPGVYPNSCPLSQWCHPTISSSVVPFSFHLHSFPASGFFQMSQFLTSGGQSIGVSASASVFPMNIQDWFPLECTGWISLQSKGLSRVFSNTTVQKHQFFGTQLSL